MLPMALGSSVNTWVSNSLGAGKALLARSLFRSGMALVVLLQTIIAGSLVLGGKHVAQVGGGAQACRLPGPVCGACVTAAGV